jgi:hypothetical protein
MRKLHDLVGEEHLRQLTLDAPHALLVEGVLPSPIPPPEKRSRNPVRKMFSGIGG